MGQFFLSFFPGNAQNLRCVCLVYEFKEGRREGEGIQGLDDISRKSESLRKWVVNFVFVSVSVSVCLMSHTDEDADKTSERERTTQPKKPKRFPCLLYLALYSGVY